MTTYDVAVVGGGPSGLSTAMYAGLRGLRAVAFEAQEFGGQLVNLYPGKPVTNFPALAPLPSRALALRLAEQAASFGADLRERCAVEHVGRREGGFALRGCSGVDVAPALVLTLGLGRFSPRRLGLDGEERFHGHGLTYSLPPLEEVHARRVVVVGGGDTAVDTALSLQQVTNVTLVHRSEQLRAFAHSQEQLAKARVDVLAGAEVVGLRGRERLEGVVVALRDRHGLELPADLLLVAIGQAPDLSGLERWGLDVHGPRVPVDTAMRTDTRGVFAAGDFAEYPGKVRMIATATAEGSTAAAAVERYLASPGEWRTSRAAGRA